MDIVLELDKISTLWDKLVLRRGGLGDDGRLCCNVDDNFVNDEAQLQEALLVRFLSLPGANIWKIVSRDSFCTREGEDFLRTSSVNGDS
ncbi:MAG: hypothetical protein LBB63_02160 [Holosporaceae bacterium]|jgi:hypothetical protein|nr:hypothetical protein [Holosporaceae bacterium]